MNTILTFPRPGATLSLLLGLALVLSACGGAGSGGDGASACPGTGTTTVENGEARICADDLAFDATTIQAPANEEFNVTFTNAESQPHNVAIYTEEGGEEIVIGDIITGPNVTNQVAVDALEPGTYYFRCDLHPEMEGELIVS
jgi:plastocyanin